MVGGRLRIAARYTIVGAPPRRSDKGVGVMLRIVALLAVFLAGLVGCATDATIRTTTAEMPGTYYSGDGLGRNVTVVLRPDGTYTSDWQGCLGVYGESAGNWLVQDAFIVFHPTQATDLLAGYLTRGTTIQYAGRLGFALDQDVRRDRVSENLVFLRTPPSP